MEIMKNLVVLLQFGNVECCFQKLCRAYATFFVANHKKNSLPEIFYREGETLALILVLVQFFLCVSHKML